MTNMLVMTQVVYIAFDMDLDVTHLVTLAFCPFQPSFLEKWILEGERVV